MSSELLTPDEVAELLGVSVQTLASWRASGRYDLPFVKIGRMVRYRAAAVEDFLEDVDTGDDGDDDDQEDDDDEE